MAEGWARALLADHVEAYSAGTTPQGLNRLAVIAMREVGIDISHHESKAIASLGDLDFDRVITVCDSAHESCPTLPAGARVIHQGFDDPPRLAHEARSDTEALPHYRRVRDEIKEFVQRLPDVLQGVFP